MDRGDTGFIIHESFKDLKTRRAEQEAYRKALEEQIMQKRKLQEQEREKQQGRRTQSHSTPSNMPQKTAQSSVLFSPRVPPPESMIDNFLSDASGHPKGRVLSYNDVDSFDEPHPVVVAGKLEEPSAIGTTTSTASVQNIPPECMKYLQQVMPGFTLPALPTTPSEYNDNALEENGNQTPMGRNELYSTPSSTGADKNQAFSSGTSSESSSVEDFQTPVKTKIHVSQTSEQLEGVKVSRKQYREELQKQIDERKQREEEQRRKAEEEEQRIQEKIRIEQEKMQREYEEELKKQEEREREAENKRMAALALARKIENIKPQEECNVKSCRVQKHNSEPKLENGDKLVVNPSNSQESIESIDEFFDEAMPRRKQYIDPDERIIPVVAKKLKEKRQHIRNSAEDSIGDDYVHHERDLNNENISRTARVDSVFSDPVRLRQDEGPPLPPPGLIREMAIRSAPCPTTGSCEDMEFLSTLKTYLQSEKSKIDERIQAKVSKSSEKF